MEFEEKGDVHDGGFIYDDGEGRTPVTGRRSNPGSDCSLHIPAGADVHYSPDGGKPGLEVTTNCISS